MTENEIKEKIMELVEHAPSHDAEAHGLRSFVQTGIRADCDRCQMLEDLDEYIELLRDA